MAKPPRFWRRSVRADGLDVQSPCVLLMAEPSTRWIKAVWGRHSDGVPVGYWSEVIGGLDFELRGDYAYVRWAEGVS